MIVFNKKRVAARIKELRNSRNWSQSKMACELDKRIGRHPQSPHPVLVLDIDSGKQVVSDLERIKRGVTYDLAFTYADIFNVSLDYVLCKTNDKDTKNKETKESLGLSDDAIKVLETSFKQKQRGDELPIHSMHTADCVNILLEYDEHSYVIDCLYEYLKFKDIARNNKSLFIEGSEIPFEYLNDIPFLRLQKALIELRETLQNKEGKL